MKRMQMLFGVMAVISILSGCGRHKDNPPAAGSGGGGSTTATTTADFTAHVKQLFAASETDEPIDIEATTFTGVETDDEAVFDSLLQ